jgi:hypothetical protein
MTCRVRCESDDVAEEVRLWMELVNRSRGILERIIQYRPDGPLAAKAKACLGAM